MNDAEAGLLQVLSRVCSGLARWEQCAQQFLRALGPKDFEALHAALDRLYTAIEDDLNNHLPSEQIAAATSAATSDLLGWLQVIDEPDWDGSPASYDNRLVPAAIAKLRLIDAWFAAVLDLSIPASNDEQESFRSQFDFDGMLVVKGGVILPKAAKAWSTSLDGPPPSGLFARFLNNITYLPAFLARDNPDELRQVDENPIATELVRWASPELTRLPWPDSPIFAVAPLAEMGSDVSFRPNQSRDRYALQLNYDHSRLASALSAAMEEGAHVLLVPEMALPEVSPHDFDERISGLIHEARLAFNARYGQAPQFRLLIAGVLGDTRDDGFHRNYCVMFDAAGERIEACDQLKLSHWNITHEEQKRFGIDYYHGDNPPLANPIQENSKPAEQLQLVEVPGFGRIASFICADMSQNNPGDWLFLNAMLDWIYAPVMDKSICWAKSDGRGSERSWIVQRTYRTARLSGTMVTATNSLSLTRWVNEANGRNGVPIKFDEAGLGLAIDGRQSPPTYNHLTVNVSTRQILLVFDPNISGWPEFPLPA